MATTKTAEMSSGVPAPIKDRTFEYCVVSDMSGTGTSFTCYDSYNGSILYSAKSNSIMHPNSLVVVQSPGIIIGCEKDSPVLKYHDLRGGKKSEDKVILPGKFQCLVYCERMGMIFCAIEDKIYGWSIENGDLKCILRGFYQQVSCLFLDGREENLTAGGEDGQVFTWNVKTMLQRQLDEQLGQVEDNTIEDKTVWASHSQKVTAIDGVSTLMASVSIDANVMIRNVSTNQEVVTISFEDSLFSVAMSLNHLYCGSQSGVIHSVSFNPHNQSKNPSSLLKEKSHQQEKRFIGHQGAVTSLSLSMDGSRLFSGGRDGIVRSWDTSSRQVMMSFPHPGVISNCFLTPCNIKSLVELDKPKDQLKLPKFSRDMSQYVSRAQEVSKALIEEEAEMIPDLVRTKSVSFSREMTFITGAPSGNLTQDLNESPELVKRMEELKLENDKLRQANSDMFQYVCNKLINKNLF